MFVIRSDGYKNVNDTKNWHRVDCTCFCQKKEKRKIDKKKGSPFWHKNYKKKMCTTRMTKIFTNSIEWNRNGKLSVLFDWVRFVLAAGVWAHEGSAWKQVVKRPFSYLVSRTKSVIDVPIPVPKPNCRTLFHLNFFLSDYQQVQTIATKQEHIHVHFERICSLSPMFQ